MTTKTFNGSCHCGAVRWEADIDFSKGTLKCNCTICAKSRNWSVGLKPSEFRLLTDKSALSDYQWNSKQAHSVFCSTCGVRSYSYGNIPEIGGDYVAIQVACLDDATPEELLSGPIMYADGLHDNWFNPPTETRHL